MVTLAQLVYRLRQLGGMLMTASEVAAHEKKGKDGVRQPCLVSEGASALASLPSSGDIKEDVRLHEIVLIKHIWLLSFSHHGCPAADSTCHGPSTQGTTQHACHGPWTQGTTQHACSFNESSCLQQRS